MVFFLPVCYNNTVSYTHLDVYKRQVKYTELIDEMISLAMKRERERESITYSFDTNVLSGIDVYKRQALALGADEGRSDLR